MERRTFIRNTALAAAGAALMPEWTIAKASYPKKLVGLQLYSVRAAMKADPLGTLQKLAAMGYKYVEHANYIDRKFYGYTAREFRKILDDLGLKMPSGHTVFTSQHWNSTKKEVTDTWKYTVEDAAVCGQVYVISPWLEEGLRKTGDLLKGAMDSFNRAGAVCQAAGMKFGYHNHDFEFSQKLDGQTVYDIMLTYTDPAMVMQQLDIGNMYNGGAQALDIVKKYPGRFESWHIKDEITATEGHEKYESTILGKGIVPVKEVMAIAKATPGPSHFIVEQESYQGIDPLECMKINIDNMRSWGYRSK